MPVPSPSPADRRERAIRLTVIASVAAKAFSVLCTFAQVPLALHYLGTEAYGFWVTSFSIVLILNTFDFGLGVGMQHVMAKAYGGDSAARLLAVFWTGAALLGLLGVGLFALSAAVAAFWPWADILHLQDPLLRLQARAALLIAVGSFALSLPLNAVARLSWAVQRGWINAVWIAVGSAVSLGLAAAASHWRWGFLWFLCASLLVPTLQGLGLFVHLFSRLGWRMVPAGLASSHETGLMLRSSGYFTLPQAGSAFLQSAPALAISVAAGPAAVTAYTLLLRLFSPFQQGQLMHLTPVWPAYTEAAERKDYRWVRHTFVRTLGIWAALAAGVAFATWQSAALLKLWIGTSAAPVTPGLAAAVGLWCILQMAVQPLMYLLIGTGCLRQLAWWGTPGFVLSAVVLFVAARTGSARLLLESGSLSAALTLLPPLAWQSLRELRRQGSQPDA